MSADGRALADLAGSVADGAAIDWRAAEARSSAAERRLVGHLRLVERIATLHRTIPSEPEDALPAPATDAAGDGAEPSGPRWGRLVVLEAIGRGSSGEVFRAWDSELHREVALKLLTSNEGAEGHARVLQEARRLARVRHPHVVQVYGAEQHDERVGLWMELVRGESLEQIVRTRGRFGAAEAAIVGRDLAAALAAVHGAGLLHRDLKAQNVLRESGGRIVLMDFGTGEELRGSRGSARLTGTPLYLAPELFRGGHASVQSDLYSLGVLLFYLVTGEYPVVSDSHEGLAAAHARGRVRRLRDLRPDLPASFVGTIERALDPEPAARFRSAGEMESALRGRPRQTWERTILAALVLGALAATALAGIFWSRGNGGATPADPGRITRIAVLPLGDLSGSAAAPHLADALTDQLIVTLGQIASLRVASRTSILPFKGTRPSVQQVFDALHVDALVEGTVDVAGGRNGQPERMRLNARVITAGGDVAWAGTFERAIGDTLALQADLARAVAAGVKATVTRDEDRRLAQVRVTTPAAEAAYFQGLYNLHQLGADQVNAAVEAFRRAAALDVNYPQAYAGLARAHLTLGFMRITSHAEARAAALPAATRAAALDPESSEAHEVLADLKFYYDWDWQGAEAAYRKAIELGPSSARARTQYARYLISRGRSDEAIAEANAAAALDPLSPGAASTQALMHYYTREYGRALADTERALKLDPRSAGAYFIQSRIHAARDALAEAVAANDRALQLAGRAATGWRAHRIMLQALTGDIQGARDAHRALAGSLERQNERLGPGQLAYIELAFGNRQAALQHLERAAYDRDPDLLWLAVDPRVDGLRGEERFRVLLQLLGLPVLDPRVRLP